MTAKNDAETVCIANIGRRERQKRLRFGVVLLAAGAGLAMLLVALGADRPWRLLLVLPFWAGGAGVLQAREKT